MIRKLSHSIFQIAKKQAILSSEGQETSTRLAHSFFDQFIKWLFA